jgi:hypothetical protein
MPRRARLLAAGYPMHVIVRGIDRCAVFFDGNDYRFFLNSLGAAAKSEGVAAQAYVLMTADEDRGVSAVMKRLGQRYVQCVNRTYSTHRRLVRRAVAVIPDRGRSLSPGLPTLHRAQCRACRDAEQARPLPLVELSRQRPRTSEPAREAS